MAGVNITTSELVRCRDLLYEAAGPMTAIEIAEELGLGGCRETKRRHVRAIIEVLRDKGHKIIGDSRVGYWFARTQTEWVMYLDSRQIGAKQVLGKTHKAKKLAYPDGTWGIGMRTLPCPNLTLQPPQTTPTPLRT